MDETILNIYLVIDSGVVVEFKAKGYQMEGRDSEKIKFLKDRVEDDLPSAFRFDAPIDRNGNFMKYNKFAKLEKQGMHFQLFEEIFSKFEIPESPLICVTPIVDGKIFMGDSN